MLAVLPKEGVALSIANCLSHDPILSDPCVKCLVGEGNLVKQQNRPQGPILIRQDGISGNMATMFLVALYLYISILHPASLFALVLFIKLCRELMTCQNVVFIFPHGAMPSACIVNKNVMGCVGFRLGLDNCQIGMSRGESSQNKKSNQDERGNIHFSNIIDRRDIIAY